MYCLFEKTENIQKETGIGPFFKNINSDEFSDKILVLKNKSFLHYLAPIVDTMAR